MAAVQFETENNFQGANSIPEIDPPIGWSELQEVFDLTGYSDAAWTRLPKVLSDMQSNVLENLHQSFEKLVFRRVWKVDTGDLLDPKYFTSSDGENWTQIMDGSVNLDTNEINGRCRRYRGFVNKEINFPTDTNCFYAGDIRVVHKISFDSNNYCDLSSNFKLVKNRDGVRDIPHKNDMICGIVERDNANHRYFSRFTIVSEQFFRFFKLVMGLYYRMNGQKLFLEKEKCFWSNVVGGSEYCVNNATRKVWLRYSDNNREVPVDQHQHTYKYQYSRTEVKTNPLSRLHEPPVNVLSYCHVYTALALFLTRGECPNSHNIPQNFSSAFDEYLQDVELFHWDLPVGFFTDFLRYYGTGPNNRYQVNPYDTDIVLEMIERDIPYSSEQRLTNEYDPRMVPSDFEVGWDQAGNVVIGDDVDIADLEEETNREHEEYYRNNTFIDDDDEEETEVNRTDGAIYNYRKI